MKTLPSLVRLKQSLLRFSGREESQLPSTDIEEESEDPSKIGKVEKDYFENTKSVPQALYIEPTNVCNANCIFCAYQFDERPKKTINESIFRKAVDQYATNGGKRIGLTPFAGEIFVDKGILEKVKYISSKAFEKIHSYTNASLLHRFSMDEILDSGFTELYISLSPPDEELYKKIYRNSSYNKVMSNISSLLKAFAQSKTKTVNSISIEFRADRSLKECQRMPDYLEYIAPFLSSGVEVRSMNVYDAWSGAIKEGDLLPGMSLKDSNFPKTSPCARIFNVQVMSDGEMRLCGCRYDNTVEEDELAIGNISDISIEDAYNSPEARRKVGSFRSGELLEVCRKCSWYEKA